MTNKIKLTSHFEKRYKRFVKKFVSLENDVDELVEQLKETQPLVSHSVRASTKFALL